MCFALCILKEASPFASTYTQNKLHYLHKINSSSIVLTMGSRETSKIFSGEVYPVRKEIKSRSASPS